MSTPLVFLAAARDLPPGEAWLQSCERAALARLRAPRRRRDFRLGRFAARQALALVEECDPVDAVRRFEVRRAPGGAPLAFRDGSPLAVSLSISHSDGRAAAGVQKGRSRLGCDLERIDARSPAFVADYFTAREQELVAEGGDALERVLRATLVWSAKEAVMKALGEGLRLPPLAVEVWPSLAAASPAGWRPLTVSRPRLAADLPGWWRAVDGFLITVVGGVGEPRLVRTRARSELD